MAKIMVVDDSFFMCNLITKILEEDEHEVVCVHTGHELIDTYGDVKPDIVFLDILMPDMNGTQALMILLNKFPDAKVIMCSSMGGQEEIINEVIELGAKCVIGKPFSVNEVRRAIDNNI